jgi:RNA polymerase sigma-70 factor (ECF subfamily)
VGQLLKQFKTKTIDNLQADIDFNGDANSVSKSHCYFTRKQQLVFKMKYFEELKYEEISEILGISRCFEGIIPSCGKKIELIITTG